MATNASNYQAAKNFYVGELGFEILRENHRPEKNDTKLDLKLGSQELKIFVFDQFPARPSHPETSGLRHLAFRVEHTEKVIAFLSGQEVEIEPLRVNDFTGKRITFFFDPDRLPLELHEQ